MGANENG
jgi:hypothetical protein